MPLKSIKFERLFKEPADLSHLMVFGYLCYITTSKVHISKFDPRADARVLIGYPPHQKAYKVLNLATNKSMISRDVFFHEKHFPFHFYSTPSTDYSTQFFLPVVTPFSSREDSFSTTNFDPLHIENVSISPPIFFSYF